MRELMRRALAVVVTASQAAASARVIVCVLILTGSTCAIVAAFMVSGTPGALAIASVICFAIAYIALRGLPPNV